MTDLLRQLLIAKSLANTDWSSVTLCKKFAISVATFKRDLRDIRHYGAVITAYKQPDGGFLYHLENWPRISRTVDMWIELEQKRDLTLLG